MAYVDVTLTPAATYTYVHNGQIYDQIATTLAAHSNWQYVEYVDAISGADTYRRHVWRCKAAGTGLPSDFYVMFQTRFVTATGVYSQTQPVYLMLAEAYSGGTLSKIASAESSITPASDLTNPATWALSTFAAAGSAFWAGNGRYVCIGPTLGQTSIRLVYIVAKDGLMSNWGPNNVGAGAPVNTGSIYVGMYDTLLGSVADPMPIVSTASTSGASGQSAGGTTRAPLMTAGVAVAEIFSAQPKWYGVPASSAVSLGNANPRASSGPGTLGSVTDTTWMKSDGGVWALRCYLSTIIQTQSNSSVRGLVRGYYKYVRCVPAVTSHSAGDTFLIDGKVYVGLGQLASGLWDTTAT